MTVGATVVTAAIEVVGAASASAFSFAVATFAGAAFGIGIALSGAGVSLSSSTVCFVLLSTFVFAVLRLESATVGLFVTGFLAVIAYDDVLTSLFYSYAKGIVELELRMLGEACGDVHLSEELKGQIPC